ncbi:MAG: hypothetical protein ACTTJV_07665 [Ottowia sp.]
MSRLKIAALALIAAACFPQLLHAKQADEPADEQAGNAALVMLGFNAPFSGGDPVAEAVALGRRRLAFERWSLAREQDGGQTDEAAPTLAQAVPEADVSLHAVRAIAPDALRCAPLQGQGPDCIGHILAHGAQWQTLLAGGQGWLARLAALAQAPRYSPVRPVPGPATAALPWLHLARAHDLALAQAALHLAGGQPGLALRQFDTAAQAMQRVAAQEGDLVGSMVALAQMQRSLHWAASALRHTPALARQPAWAAALRRSLARLQIDLAPALAGENAMLARALTLACPPPQAAHACPGQRQSEAALRALELLTRAARASAPQARAAWQQARAQAEKQAGEEAAQLLPDYGPYLLRTHDLQGYSRLVQLQLAALQEAVPPAQMPAWLNSRPAPLRNPYTQAPMQWDAASASLIFQGQTAAQGASNPPSAYRVRLFDLPGTPPGTLPDSSPDTPAAPVE